MDTVLLFGIIWKKINIHCELVTSQPHWFSGSQLDFSKFSIFNNMLVYSPICIKFALNCLVLETFSFCLCLTVSDPFPLIWIYNIVNKIFYMPYNNRLFYICFEKYGIHLHKSSFCRNPYWSPIRFSAGRRRVQLKSSILPKTVSSGLQLLYLAKTVTLQSERYTFAYRMSVPGRICERIMPFRPSSLA